MNVMGALQSLDRAFKRVRLLCRLRLVRAFLDLWSIPPRMFCWPVDYGWFYPAAMGFLKARDCTVFVSSEPRATGVSMEVERLVGALAGVVNVRMDLGESWVSKRAANGRCEG